MSTARPSTTPDLDTRQMVLLHRCMRNEFRLAPGAVRRVADAAAAGAVADHLEFLITFVRHHHELEDELLWPVLRPRLDGDQASTVELMESQHHALAAVLERLEVEVRNWRDGSDHAAPIAVSSSLDEMYPLLVEHLDAEEQRLLPIAARTLTLVEWERLGEEGHRRSPRRYRSLALGMFDHYGEPEVVATMIAPIPRLLRPLVLSGARRTFRRHALRVHGTPAP